MDKKKFIDNLLSKMTLREKIGQMYQAINDGGVVTGPNFQKSNFYEELKKGEVGSILGLYDNRTLKEIQRIATEETRLKIPIMNCCDIIHGCRTILPINLAMSSSWNPKLIEKANQMVAFESTHSGVDLTFAPMLDIARDPRWGRVAEGNGEDPYLAKKFAMAEVKGYKKGGLASCAKHFVGYGACTGGRDYDSVDMSKTTLFEYYLPPFKAAIDAGCEMVMNSFNTFNGIPVGVNEYLLKKVLRKILRFEGVLITDWCSMEEVLTHKAAVDSRDVSKKSLVATVDHEMVSRNYVKSLEKLVEEKEVSINLIDEAVRRILNLKYDLGLFTDPYKNIRLNEDDYYLLPKSKDVALKMGEESIILLENDGVLPLSKNSKVSYIGNYITSRHLCGCWAGKVNYSDTVTILDALQDGKYKNYNYYAPKDLFNVTDEDLKLALEISKNSDIIVIGVGEDEEMSGESHSRCTLGVIDAHERLVDALVNLGKKVVLMVFAGRPLVLTKYKRLFDEGKISAILYTWFLGTMAGKAIINTLYGINNPSGKTSISFPQSLGQIPCYYNQLPSGRPNIKGGNNDYRINYVDGDVYPLYPFGYGLSYSKFVYHDFTLDKLELSKGKINITVDIENVSNVGGFEIIEAYINSPAGKISRPVKELKAFKKVFIKAHERLLVKLSLDTKKLMYHDEEKLVPYYGVYKLYVGTSSDESRYKEFCIKLNI